MLAGGGGHRYYPLLQRGGRGERGGGGQPGGGLAQSGDFPRALGAPGQVALEPGPFGRGQGVHGEGPGQRVDVRVTESHSATPRQSRSRISASRILVLTVPAGTPSRLAT